MAKFMARTPDGEYHELLPLDETKTIEIDGQAVGDLKDFTFDWDKSYCKEPERNPNIGHIDGLCTPEIAEMFAEETKPENAVCFTFDNELVSEQFEQEVAVHDSTWVFIEEQIYRCLQRIANKLELGTTVRFNYKIDCTNEKCEKTFMHEYTVTVYWVAENP